MSYLSALSSGLRRNDGSIVEGTTGNLSTTVNNQSFFLRRPEENLQGADLVKDIQNRIQQRDVKSPAFNKYAQDVFNTQGFPTQSFQHYQNQFNEQSPTQIGNIVSLDKFPPGGAMIPEQGPLGPGLVGGTTPQTGINLPGNSGTPMGGSFTLTGMAQQPMQQPIQNPLGGGLSSLNQQPFGGGLGSMNQQPQQMNSGLKGLLDSYIGNYINNYFMNALK